LQSDGSPESRILVVGAGSTGASTAYHLAKAGAKVVLMDGGQVASGTTSKSTALVRTHYSNEIVAKMALYSLRVFEKFPESGFVNNGMLIISSELEKSALETNAAMLSGIGVRNESLTPKKAKEKFPELNAQERDYILYEPESGYADPVGTATAYASKASQLGAMILTGNRVNRIQTSSGHVKGVEFAGGSQLNAGKVILCTNVWTNELLSVSGVVDKDLLPLWAAAHPVLVLRRPDSYLGTSHPSVADLPNKTYYKPEGKSLFFAGSLDAGLDNERIDPDEPPTEVPFELLSYYSETVSKRIPVMSEGTLHSSYIGMYDMTPDQHPIIDELEQIGFEGLYCCVGLSGHGFKLCPALGLMNTEMMLGRNLGNGYPSFDRTFFSLSRFKEGTSGSKRLLSTRYPGVGTIA
jgi:sarcosine oxidase, subunit beta